MNDMREFLIAAFRYIINALYVYMARKIKKIIFQKVAATRVTV